VSRLAAAVAVSSINEHTGLDIETPADDSGVEPAMQSDDAVMGVAEPVVASYGSFTDPVAPIRRVGDSARNKYQL
jgi:hypothetical protein